jgi:hypothetical protein
MSTPRRTCLTRLTPFCGVATWGLIGAAAVALTACASSPARRDACLGNRVLVVYNNTDSSVDIVSRDSRGERMLGIADAGRREFSLTDVPEGASFAAKRGSNYVTTAFANGSAARRVEFNVVCR